MKNLITIISLLFSSSVLAKFSHTSEASVVVTGGNTSLSTYNFKTTNRYPFYRYTGTFGGHYTLGKASEVVSTRNWDANAKFDTKIFNDIGLFLGEVVEGDKFAGYEKRFNTDLGVSLVINQTENTYLSSEVGYRNTYEDNISDAIESKTEHKGRLYLNFEYNQKDKYKFSAFTEYLPNFTDSDGFIINFGTGLTFSMTSILSIKFGYDGEYDNQPSLQGNKKFDYLYTTSLISSF